MRCLACDSPLTDRDTSRKGVYSGEYIDFCRECYRSIKDQIEVVENTKAKDIIEDPEE